MKKITLIFFMSLLSFLGYAQLPKQGFETGWTLASTGTAAAGWFTVQNGIGPNFTWVQGPANSATLPAFEGERAAYLQREQVATGLAEDYLVTPAFNVPADPEIHFYSRLTQADNQGSIYKVLILNLTDNPGADLNAPASYTVLQTWTETEINPVQDVYYAITVAVPAEHIGDQVRIAFMMANDFGDRWLVDNVEVVKKCTNPTTLIAENITMTSADLTWDNPSGSTKWNIELVGEDDTPTGVPTDTYEGVLPYPADALTEDTCYKYYVQSVCSDGGKSEWVGAFYFCTKGLGDTCQDPIVVTPLPFTDTDDTANYGDEYNGTPGSGCGNNPWEDYLSGNDVVYKYTATFTGQVNIDLTNAGPNSGIFVYDTCADIGDDCLTGGTGGFEGDDVSLEEFPVTSGQDYYIVISTYSEPTTPYTLTIQAVACDEPVGLPVANIGMTSAEFSWTSPAGTTSWGLAVQPAGTGVPSGTGTTVTDNTNYLWSPLTPSTAYEYWVRVDCNNGTFSAWAGPYYFNSMACEAVDQCSFTFTMWDEWDTWNGHTMSVKQNGITIATLTGPGNDGEPVDLVIPLCNSSPVQLFWNAGGSSWAAGEIGVSVTNSFGQEIYLKEPGQGTPNTLLYEVVVDCDHPYCLAPKGLTATNPTETTVDLGWAGPATGEWEYYIVEAGDPAPADTDTGTSTTTNPTLAAGPLVSSTNYEFYVRMLCEDASTEVSPWSKPFKFASSVCNPTDKCDYDFTMRSNWWSGWEGATMTIRQNGTDVAVIGPSFTGGQTQTVTVGLCHNIPFEIFWNTGGDWEGQVGLTVINSFDQTIFDLPFNSTGVTTVIYTGEVNCLYPACLPPTGLTALNGTMTSIDLKWDGPATGDWEYVIVPAGDPAPTAATPGTATTNNPTIAAPLAAPATNYEYYVRVVCTGASTPTSGWAGPYAMHSEVCNPEDKCTFFFELQSENGWNFGNNVMVVSQGGVTAAILGPQFTWEADDQNSYMVEVPLCPDVPIEIFWNEEGWDEQDKGLHVYTPYMEDVYIKGFGEGEQGTELFNGLVSCDPPPCPKPQHLEVSDVGLTEATVEWDEMGEATSWEVWVLPYGSPAPTTPGTSTTVHPFEWPEPLTSGTPYVFYVRAICGGANGNSTWSGPFTFVTDIENDDCDSPVTVPVNDGVECIQTVAGTMTGATSSGVMASCTWAEPEWDVWYEFVATSSTHVISLNNQVDIDVNYGVFEGTDCGDLTEISCGNDAGIVGGLTVGNTYLIQVYSTWFPNESTPTSFEVCVSTPKSIVVDNTTYTVPQIVQNALVVETCANIENVTWSTGTDFGGENGIAYFEKGLSSFPMENGVVLMTGNAMKSPGPNIGDNLGDGGWPGDDDLFDYMTDLGLNPGSYNDATILEFDFTPLSNKLKFPFIFASEEYGQYQCTFSDAFAFFLTTDDGTGPVTVNLAVVPETDSPVSVVTIRDDAFNLIWDTCPSVNEAYFDKYYGDDAVQQPELITDPLLAPINFEGHTIKMYARADVIPNQVYHIKLVIADRGDTNMDSAVFIGAFDIGSVDLGTDLTIADGNGLCKGASHTIESELDPADYTFTWYKLNDAVPPVYVVMDGETGPSLTVTSPGDYKVVAQFSETCVTTDSVKIEFYKDVEVITNEPAQLTVCDADGFGTFDLEDNTPIILDNPEAVGCVVSYHLTEDDAQDNLNPLPLTGYDNVTQFEQVIYVRIINLAGCVGIKTFSLVVQDLTPIFTVNQDFSICEGTSGTITVTPTEPANYDPTVATYSWTFNGGPLPDTTSSITATVAGVYEATVNNTGCAATDSVTIVVIPTPIADDPADVAECVSYTLPALSANNRYFTGTGGTGTALSAGDAITSTQVVYVFAQNPDNPACTAENSFTVTIIPTPIVAIVESCEGNNYVLEVIFDGDEIYNADNVTFDWTNTAGASLGTGSTLIVTVPDTYKVTVTPVGFPISCPSVGEAQIDNTTCLIPRGISPNNDGKNDSFDLTTLDVSKLEIFNRYGQEVYSKRNYTNEWKGQGSNGDELPTGTYFYMIERSNGESITGWVYINRQE